MTKINDLILKRFGIGAFASTAKNKVALRRIAGNSYDPKNGQFQSGFTVPRDLIHLDDLAHMYIVHRDANGNYIYEKTDLVDKEAIARYS